ncbi:hypothetical protein E3N88_19685 [Mikania micrantha]|uniref:TCP domain-containing protein n=1 Tax=Mikania micrantha TaxID=192012 RepID=A0A5N6NQA4_9ASTR|nr:hypothetical protein E3N88_19685 [Mikania micrantha]
MEYAFSSSNNEATLFSLNNKSNNLDSNRVENGPLFEQFPSHMFDDRLHMTSSTTANEQSVPTSSKTKRMRKKRSAGKADRHSKIHTAQGLRDRRMRLSLHIAHKFFGLQDMLGFDKASKTIEWLFCKSKKAIDEVTESIRLQSSCRENIESQVSDYEVDSEIEFDAASYKGKQLKVHEEINNENDKSKKPTTTESEQLAKELRDKARARARERTRERMMINNVQDKSKQVFGTNYPNDDFDQSQLGFSGNPNNPYIEYSSSSPLEYPAGTHHYFHHTHLHNVAQTPEEYLGRDVASSSTYFSGNGYNKNFVNPSSAGWLNSSNTFLGLLGGWDSENFIDNYQLYSNLAQPTGDIHGQNISSVLIPPSNLAHFQNQNQKDY